MAHRPWQTDGKVRHLIARKLVDRTELLGRCDPSPLIATVRTATADAE